MKTRIIMLSVIISLALLSNAYPQDKAIEGEVSLTGIWVNVDGREGGKAKFTEYKDLKEDGGIYGRAKLKLDTEKYFLNFDGGDFAYDTQFYKIDGGIWGNFKFDLFYDEIPHNITFDARTPFLGAGHDTLVGTPNTNVSTWNTFDHSIERHQYGGGLKVDLIKPFFFDTSFQREEREGIKPNGAAETSPGGRAFELPEPVDYITNNLKASLGYAQKPLFLSFNYVLSEFNNGDTRLNLPSNFEDPRAFSLPPDNTYQKGTFKGAVVLPYNSKFSTNLGFSKGESETPVVSLIGSDYEGKVETQNYDFALTSNPVRFLDAKVYYKYYRRHNESDDSTGVVELFFDYRNTTLGGELGLRLPAQFYLNGGYKYVRLKRVHKGETDPLGVFPFNTDHVYFADLKWSGLDFLEARIGYERFDRDVTYQTAETAVDPSRRFPYAAQNKNTYKAVLDIFPLENLNVGLEYRHRKIDYSDTTFGLRNDKRNEFETSADYVVGKIGKVYGYADFGRIEFDRLQQKTAGLPAPADWGAKMKETTYGYGIGNEIYVIPKKLILVFQHDYVKSNGSVNFTLADIFFQPAGGAGLAGIGANNSNIDISRWDDYTLYSIKVKTIYNFTKSLAASLGYAYERFKYSDAQLDNYNFAPTGGTNAAILTGAYKDQSYKANLVFGGLTYKF